MTARVVDGDCLLVMPTLDAESVDAIVCDPPYHLTTGKKGGTGAASVNLNSPTRRARITAGFMGKVWDGGDVAFRPETWVAALRVAKPGAHLVAFGGTRTYHRLTCAIEDAGWEIRDCLSWLYGSGFPKSHDVSKAIDKAAGHIRPRVPGGIASNGIATAGMVPGEAISGEAISGEAISGEAARWNGWGTALKPAWEPIILARKPFPSTVAANVIEHSTGALNIDACRIATDEDWAGGGPTERRERGVGYATSSSHELGRWPANVVLDEAAAALLDAQSGEPAGIKAGGKLNVYGRFAGGIPVTGYGDLGGASRFFYTAKASRSEREAGLREAGLREAGTKHHISQLATVDGRGERRVANTHPTVKPLELMQWLCRLITPKGGLILDPFTGSGSTGRAAIAEGFSFVGIELEPEYAAIARARIAEYAPLFADGAA